jgi:hypothetical protein
MDHSNLHSTTLAFNKLNKESKQRLISLMKMFVNDQELNKKFTLFDLQSHYNYRNVLNNYPYDSQESEYQGFFKIFKTKELFDQIIKLTTKETLYARLTPVIKNNLLNKTKEECEYLLKFINLIIIGNVIVKKLKTKTREQINIYNLFDKLSGINVSIISLFNLGQLYPLFKKDEINEYITKRFNYHSINVNNLIQVLKDENYKQLFDVINLFD